MRKRPAWMDSFARLAKVLWPFRKKVLVLVVLGVCTNAFFLIGPYFSKLFIDTSFLKKDMQQFFRLAIAGGLLFAFSTFFRLVEYRLKISATLKVKLALSDRFARKLYSLDLASIQKKSIGESLRQLSDIENISKFFIEWAPSFITDLARVAILISIALWINVPLTCALLAVSPLFLLQSLYIRKRLYPLYEAIWQGSARILKHVQEALSRIIVVKAFGWESIERHAYLRLLLENMRREIRGARLSMASLLASAFLSKLVYGLISLYGGWLIIKGSLSLGSFTALMLYLTQAGSLLQSLSTNFEYFVKDAVLADRFFKLMELDPVIKDSPGATTLHSLPGAIRFTKVRFGYEPDKDVFPCLDFSIPAGKWVGIAGPSGCGKTTLLHLILRLYDPWAGGIALDGLDVKSIRLQSLRQRIALATQEPLLFDFSIKDNIRYGMGYVSDADIEEVARLVHLHEFVLQLPKGYDTLIGENAYQLSQGYKQRLALARALVRNPDILLLDEATASIDSYQEERIFRSIRAKRKGRTTIVVSHRLFSVKDADRIYFLRDGGVIGEGSHGELLEQCASYKDFFRNQIETGQ